MGLFGLSIKASIEISNPFALAITAFFPTPNIIALDKISVAPRLARYQQHRRADDHRLKAQPRRRYHRLKKSLLLLGPVFRFLKKSICLGLVHDLR